MALATVSGSVVDLTQNSMGDRFAEIVFEMEEPVVLANGGMVIPNEPIRVKTAVNGDFSVRLQASKDTNPYAVYRVRVEWQSAEGGLTAHPKHFRIVVPEGGGQIDDMIAVSTPTRIITKGDPGEGGAGGGGTVALPAAAVLAWKPNTNYTSGQTVISPGGDPVKAVKNHYAGSTYVSANWAPSKQDARIRALEIKTPGAGGGTTIIQGAAADSARRPLIGARVGVSKSVTVPDDEYFDELHRLEADSLAEYDITNWYKSISPTSAEEFTATVKPELLKYPNRKVLYAMEGLGNNTQLIKDFDTQSGEYPHLVETLLAIKNSGVADRVILAPMHEGNGGGGTPGSIGAYAWQMYDTTEVDGVRLNTVTKYKQAFRKIVDLARDLGVPSKFCQWLLAANTSDATIVDKIDRMDMGAGYVGDAWVDIVGLSYYNRSKDPRPQYSDTWPEPGANGLREFYAAYERMTANPLWICETGCAPSNEYGNQAQWYADLVKLVASSELPRIEGVIPFMQDSRRYEGPGGAHSAGLNMKLDSILDDGGTAAQVLAAKQLFGRAVNAARRTGKVNPVPQVSRNLLPVVVADLTTTDGWDSSVGVTLAVGNQYTPDGDAMANGLRITKPAYTAGDDIISYTAYRRLSKSNIDYTPNDPYVLSFTARASYDGFKIEAGIRQDGGFAYRIGDELKLSTIAEQYVVPFSGVSDDPALTGWRMPNFSFGNNKNTQEAWFEVSNLRLSRGSVAQPNIERLLRPKVRALTGNSATDEIFWNCEAAQIFDVTLTQNFTLRAPTGVPYDGQEIALRVKQDGTGGRSLNLHPDFYSSTTNPPLTTLPYAMNHLTFQYHAAGNAGAGRWGLLYTAQWGLT